MSDSGSPCLDALRLEQYLSDALDEPERRQVEEHLSVCPDCRLRLVSTFDSQEEVLSSAFSVPTEVLDSVRDLPFGDEDGRERRARRWIAPLAACLVLAVGLAIGLRMSENEPIAPDHDQVLRSTGPSVSLELLRPAGSAHVSVGDFRLIWGEIETVERYRVTLMDPAGDIVSRQTVEGTEWAPDKPLEPGAYFWYVTAEAEGAVWESEIREFVLTPIEP